MKNSQKGTDLFMSSQNRSSKGKPENILMNNVPIRPTRAFDYQQTRAVFNDGAEKAQTPATSHQQEPLSRRNSYHVATSRKKASASEKPPPLPLPGGASTTADKVTEEPVNPVNCIPNTSSSIQQHVTPRRDSYFTATGTSPPLSIPTALPTTVVTTMPTSTITTTQQETEATFGERGVGADRRASTDSNKIYFGKFVGKFSYLAAFCAFWGGMDLGYLGWKGNTLSNEWWWIFVGVLIGCCVIVSLALCAPNGNYIKKARKSKLVSGWEWIEVVCCAVLCLHRKDIDLYILDD